MSANTPRSQFSGGVCYKTFSEGKDGPINSSNAQLVKTPQSRSRHVLTKEQARDIFNKKHDICTTSYAASVGLAKKYKVTPKSIRLRKIYLTETERKRFKI